MSVYTSLLYRGWHKITSVISGISWMGFYSLFNGGRGYNLTDHDHEMLRHYLAGSYYIILINRKTHLTTYLLGSLSLLKTRKWPQYSHALMNADAMEDVKDWDKFKFVEATSVGVHFSKFMEVFNCDSVCLLRPKNLSFSEWNAVIDGLLKQNGKQYDDLFDLTDSSYVSCVEVVLDALRQDPDYKDDFANLEKMIAEVGNLTPQMYRDCSDFEVVLEIKR